MSFVSSLCGCVGFEVPHVFWFLPLCFLIFYKQNVEVSRMSEEALLTVPAHQWGSTPSPQLALIQPLTHVPSLPTLSPFDAQHTGQMQKSLSSTLFCWCFSLHLYFKTWWCWYLTGIQLIVDYWIQIIIPRHGRVSCTFSHFWRMNEKQIFFSFFNKRMLYLWSNEIPAPSPEALTF